MKYIFKPVLLIALIFHLSEINGQVQKSSFVLLQTSLGEIKIKLYEETSMHKENFLKLAGEGYYNGLLFHRVIKDFMIQTGDPESKSAKPGVPLGKGGPSYRIPAEIFPQYYHKKGAIAAARMGDNVNPDRASSGSQFYIVQGKKYTPEQLKSMESSNQHIRFTPEQIKTYSSIGGTPHLDYAYTVFGEVIEGFDVLDSIAQASTDQRDRPINDIKIIKAYILK